jgi:hypothetical protein
MKINQVIFVSRDEVNVMGFSFTGDESQVFAGVFPTEIVIPKNSP